MPILSLRTFSRTSSLRHALLRTAPALGNARRLVSSRSLLAGARELVIQHQGSECHLRVTRNDKLILTT